MADVEKEGSDGGSYSDNSDPGVKVLQVGIIARVTNLHLVATAISYAENTYGRAKNASPALVQKTLSTGEETLKHVYNLALRRTTPVLQKWQGPIHSLDSVACSIFDKMADTVTTVTKAPGDAVMAIRITLETARNVVNSAVDGVTGNPVMKSVFTASEQVRVYLDSLNPLNPIEAANEDARTSLSKWIGTVQRVTALLFLSRTVNQRTSRSVPSDIMDLPHKVSIPKEKGVAKETSQSENGRATSGNAKEISNLASASVFKSLENLSMLVDRLSQRPVQTRQSKKARTRRPVVSVEPLTDEDREASTSAIEKATGFRAFIKRDADSQSEKSGTSEVDEETGTVTKRTKKSRKSKFTVRLYPHQLSYMNF